MCKGNESGFGKKGGRQLGTWEEGGKTDKKINGGSGKEEQVPKKVERERVSGNSSIVKKKGEGSPTDPIHEGKQMGK